MASEKVGKLYEITPEPRTRESLRADLRDLGLEAGMHAEVHSSLSNLGYVVGGAQAVIGALMDVVTEEGTILMPAFNRRLTDPSWWDDPLGFTGPAMPEGWERVVRGHMPPFDPERTPTLNMGQVAELFRTWPGVRRSACHWASWSAWGRHADYATHDHDPYFGFGPTSPLSRLYELDGRVLLLGVGLGSVSSIHLAEARAPGSPRCAWGAPAIEDGERVWKEYEDFEYDGTPAGSPNGEFEERHPARKGRVGSAEAALFSQRAYVDFATGWFTDHYRRSERLKVSGS